MKYSSEISRHLYKKLGIKIHNEEEMTPDTALALLAQIFIPLLIIFVMANVIFITKAKAEADGLKKAYGAIFFDYNDLRHTPQGIQQEEKIEALLNLQWQKILLRLSEVEHQERINLSLSTFAPKDPNNGEIQYQMSDILSDGKVINKRFKNACIYAYDVYSDTTNVRNTWIKCVLEPLGMDLHKGSYRPSILQNPEIVDPNNAEELFQEIDKRIKMLQAETYDMQCNALSFMVKYLAENRSIMQGTEIEKQLELALNAPQEDRIRMLSMWKTEILQYVRSVFQKQKIPLLRGA